MALRCERCDAVEVGALAQAPSEGGASGPADHRSSFDARAQRMSNRLTILRGAMEALFADAFFRDVYRGIVEAGDRTLPSTSRFRGHDEGGAATYAYWFARDRLAEASALERMGYRDRADGVLMSLDAMMDACERRGVFFIAMLNMQARLFFAYNGKTVGPVASIGKVMDTAEALDRRMRAARVPWREAFDSIDVPEAVEAPLPAPGRNPPDRFAFGRELGCIERGNRWRYESDFPFNRIMEDLVRSSARGRAVAIGGCDGMEAALLALSPGAVDAVGVVASSAVAAARSAEIGGRIAAISGERAESAPIGILDRGAMAAGGAVLFIVREIFEFQNDDERRELISMIRAALAPKGKAVFAVPLQVRGERFEMPDGSLVFSEGRTFEQDELAGMFERLGFRREEGYAVDVRLVPAHPASGRPREAYVVVSNKGKPSP